MEQNLERPAFPSYHGLSWKDGRLGEFHGMTLRDYFAAKVFPEVFRQYAKQANAKNQWDAGWREHLAHDAYHMADAMLKAREQ